MTMKYEKTTYISQMAKEDKETIYNEVLASLQQLLGSAYPDSVLGGHMTLPYWLRLRPFKSIASYLEEAMAGRICDIEDLIPISKYIGD